MQDNLSVKMCFCSNGVNVFLLTVLLLQKTDFEEIC